MATELDFCTHLLEKFLKFWDTNKAPYLEIFLDPVDEVEDNAPGYYTIIDSPMDLATMATKLENGDYTNAQGFKVDFDRMIQNCRDYNIENPDFVKKYADRFAREFEWEWREMRKWMSTKRRKLAREAAARASASSATTNGPNASTSGNERCVLDYTAWLSADTSEISDFIVRFDANNNTVPPRRDHRPETLSMRGMSSSIACCFGGNDHM